MKTLHYTLRKKFFDMSINPNIDLRKNEEYRAITPFWIKRLTNGKFNDGGYIFKEFDTVTAWNGGYCGGNLPNFVREFKGIRIGKARPEWSDNWQGEVFIIKLGDIISSTI